MMSSTKGILYKIIHSPLLRQVIIFVLLLLLLGLGKPIPGPDGLIHTTFYFVWEGHPSMIAGEPYCIDIAETFVDPATGRLKTRYILETIPVIQGNFQEVNPAILWVGDYVPLWKVIPRRWGLLGEVKLVIGLTPEQWDVFQSAYSGEGRLDCDRLKPDEVRMRLKQKATSR